VREDFFALLGTRARKIESADRENTGGRILRRIRLNLVCNAIATAA
jgi:hypothetical protein